MRLIPALALFSLASMAHAGSIDTVTALPKGKPLESIVTIGCASCPAPAPKKNAYAIPSLKPGQQRVELKMVNGEQKIFRTDAWVGGSPVTFVSPATKAEIAALENQAPTDSANAGDGVDLSTTTAAVDGNGLQIAPKAPIAATMDTPAAALPKPLDTSGFTLRAD